MHVPKLYSSLARAATKEDVLEILKLHKIRHAAYCVKGLGSLPANMVALGRLPTVFSNTDCLSLESSPPVS